MDIYAIPDIIMDVSNAASPAKRAAAMSTLEQGSKQVPESTVATDRPSWPATVSRVQTDNGVQGMPNAATVLQSPQPSEDVSRHASVKTPAMEFEAFVLQTFVEAMLPKESSSVFGSGTSGDVWRSMLAEHLAKEVARGGGVGIAQVIEKAPT